MICQECGKRPAVVHQEEIRDGKSTHIWLCVECAAGQGRDIPDDDGQDPLFGNVAGDEREDALSSFLGRISAPGIHPEESNVTCPACGFTLGQLGKTSRLGCPVCYEIFRAALLPLLNRLHRHTSHMGKAPRRLAGRSLESEIARRRVALEKAIQAENFEEAARLRDLIGRLETASKEAGDEPGLSDAGEPEPGGTTDEGGGS